MQFYMPPNSTPQERADGEARYRANSNRIWQAADGSWMSNTGGGIGRFQTEADAIEYRKRYTSGGVGAMTPQTPVSPIPPQSPTSSVSPSLLDMISGGSGPRQQQLADETQFAALVNANNAQSQLIGAPTQQLPQTMDQIRVDQLLNSAPNTQFGFQQQSNIQQPAQQSQSPTLLNNWQQYAEQAGWNAPQSQQPQQQSAPSWYNQAPSWYQQAPQQQAAPQAVAQQQPQPSTPPAQMSLGQVQPATQSASASNSYPGQRYQPQSLGGFNWQQPQQQQGQQQAAQLQTGQQGFGMGGQFRQRRQQGLGMLGQALIA